MPLTTEDAADIFVKYENIAKNTKRHHWVPEFYLQYFTAQEGEGQVYMYQKNSATQLTSVLNVAVKKDLYTFTKNEDGQKTRVMEGVFSEHEGFVGSVLSRVIKEGSLPDGEEDLSHIAAFVSVLRVRGPSFSRWLRNMDEKHHKLSQQLRAKHSPSLRSDLESAGVTFSSDKEFEEMRSVLSDPEGYEISMQGGEGYYFEQAMKLGKELFKVLVTQKSWHLLIAPPKRHFITSDNPVVIQEPKDCPLHLAGGFQNGTVLLTISPHLCLAFRRIPLRHKNIVLSREDVDSINKSIARAAHRQLYSHVNSKDIASLCNEQIVGDESDVSIKQMAEFSPYYVFQGLPQYQEADGLRKNGV